MLEWLNCVFFCFCTNCPYRPILSVGSHCISNWAQKRNVLVCTWHLGKRFKQGLLFSSIYVFSNMSSTHFLCGDLFHALRRPTVTAYLLMLIVRPPSKKQTLVTKRGDQYANRMHVCVCLGKCHPLWSFVCHPKPLLTLSHLPEACTLNDRTVDIPFSFYEMNCEEKYCR